MAGESLVSDLDDNSGLDTETALFVLDQFTRDFQIRGVANNQQIKKITLTENGKIPLGATAISAELISHHTNADRYNIVGILKGTGTNKRLFNTTDQTDIWDKDKEYKYLLIKSLPWEDMDTPVQRGILASAARQYQFITQGDGDADIYLQEQELLHQGKAKGADLDDKRRSVFTSSSAKLEQARTRTNYHRSATELRYWKTNNG